MTAPEFALAETDPAGFVLAVADLRQTRAMGAQPGPWQSDGGYLAHPDPMDSTYVGVDAEHIAAEANPAHALAEVALWRDIAEWHGSHGPHHSARFRPADESRTAEDGCPLMLLVVAAARAYLGAAS